MLRHMMRNLLVFLALVTSSAFAAEPRAIATFESLGIYWTPSSDPGAAGCPLKFRKQGDSAWREALPLWYDSRNRECRGSIVQLEPATTYEISVAGNQFTARTWSERFPIARTVPVGNVKAFRITEGGTPSGYVLYDGRGSVLDAEDSEPYNIVISAPYVIVRGFTLKGAKQDAIRLERGAHDVVIEDNDISGWGRYRYTNSKGWKIGQDMEAGVRAECSPKAQLERTVIQRNRIH